MTDRAGGSEADFRLLAENSTDVIVRVDPEGRLLYASPAVRDSYGYAPDELVGRPYLSLVHPDDLPAALEALERGRARPDERIVWQARIRHRDGRWVWSETTSRAVVDPSGAVRERQGSVRDITARKAVEERLRTSNEELSRFVYAASHDLREPLGVVQLATDVLAREHGRALGDEGRELLRHAQESAAQLRGLLDDLLRLAEVGVAALRREPVPLGDALADAAARLADLIARAGATVEGEDLPVVLADRGLLTRLLEDLLAGAIRLSADTKPRVRVAACRQDMAWRITVADGTSRLDPADAAWLFHPFSRVHAHGKHPGPGGGLALAQRIAERHGGRIAVEPAAAGGSLFSLTLPAD